MASEIAGQPHWEVGFDEHGKANQERSTPSWPSCPVGT